MKSAMRLATLVAAVVLAGNGVGAQQAPARTSGAYMNIGFSGLADFGWSSQANVRTLQKGDHDPNVRGFTIPNIELTFDGAVDPYFKGFANIVYKINDRAESDVELEEAYVISTAIPGNLQIKAGQYFAEFGRQNNQHPHAWSFVDEPLIMNRLFGPDGMRGQGARVSWLAPTPFYTEATLGVMNSLGGTMYSFRSDESSDIHGGVPVERDVKKGSDLVVIPRLATSFDLTSTQTIVLGVSGAFGPNNSGQDTQSQIYGADLYWKWKSDHAAAGFPFVSLQAEAMARSYDAAQRTSAADAAVTLPSETLKDRGWYAQALWGIKPRIIAGLRAESANGDSASFNGELRQQRFRLSPNFTIYPSEFSKIRLQYNYDDRKGVGRDNSLWLQFEFIMGAHAAHKF